MKRILCFGARKKNNRNVLQIISVLLFLPPFFRAQNTLGCSTIVKTNQCSCYTFENALFIDCQDTSIKDIKDALKSVTNVHSFSVYDLDGSEETLGPHLIPQEVCIKHIHISRTSIRDVDDETFVPLRKCLETISIVSSKIKFLPQKAFSSMHKLTSIELTSNYIEEIPSYSFYTLPLIKLNVKGNMIEYISDTAFSGLEQTLTEIDLSENNLTSFPIFSISKLKHLKTLRLSWNEISSFPSVEYTNLVSLEYLDLDSNNFEILLEDCLKFSPSLKILSFHFNFINSIHYRAFYSLVYLKSLDLSHNRIKVLNTYLFQTNKLLEFIDLSHNHLHHIHGLFCNMQSLTEVILSHNNILEVPIDSFHNSSNVSKIHLEKNCINSINSESFSDLDNLEELHLDYNFLNQVPHNILMNTRNLKTLRLDNNNFSELNNNTLETQVSLREIRINNNRLKAILRNHFHNCLVTEEIYLNHNKITFIEKGTFIPMIHLKYLALHSNKLFDLPDILPAGRSNLLTLYLDSNLFSSINYFIFRSQQQLYQLGLRNNQLKFITRGTFSNLTYLTRLELAENEISVIDDFSFQRLSSARFLALQNNYLRNITSHTFFGLSELEDLDISYNKIVYIYDMAFDTSKKLRSLNLSNNHLKMLHRNMFQQGLPLSTLYLDNCEIQLIENGTFNGLNNLKYLSLKNNSLKSTDLLALNISGLKFLALSYNILDYLPAQAFSQLPLLEILLMEHCNIEHILDNTFLYNKHLVKLNIAQNIISATPIKLFGLHNSISEFNISNNFLDYVPYNTLHNFTYLETLDVADNLLPKIELSGFEKLTKLKHLILRKNEIQSITSRKKVILKELVLFDISLNKLKNLPSIIFENFPNLQNLNISYNDIIKFDFLNSFKMFGVSLLNIDISKNPANSWSTTKRISSNNTLIANLYELYICSTNLSNIEDITFELFISLQHLYLKFNKIRRLSISPFSKLSQLENLDLSFNKITHLKSSNFRGLTKLSTLCLSNNNIESIESFDEDLNNLKLLDLAHNKLQNILNEDLINLKELTVLYLGYNNIKYISLTAFKNLNKIVHIDLAHNKLQSIPLELLNSIENHVQDISLKDNVIICKCQKNNTWTWIQDHPKIIKPNAVVCFNDDYPKEKCNFPMIAQVTIDKHNDNSVSVSWFIRNRTAIKGLQILYYNEEKDAYVKSKYVDKSDMSTNISRLKSNTHYILCVLTMYDDKMISMEEEDVLKLNNTDMESNTTIRMSRNIAAMLISQSPSSECVSFDTLQKAPMVKSKPKKVSAFFSFLNRRLGLIVGCILGFIVFFIMVSVLLYTKFKERKRIAKSDPAWSEMNDYHSMQSKEDILQNSTTASTDNILLGMAKNRNSSLDQLK